jgi:hypothetical protein
MRVRWSDQRPKLPGLCRTVLGTELSPGDVVIMDNLGSHKSQAVRRAIRSTGAKLIFLPAYSPDLNPIEQVLRQAQDPAPQSRRANHRGNLETHRPAPRPLHSSRVRQTTSRSQDTLQSDPITL